jgi:hypothetical protein
LNKNNELSKKKVDGIREEARKLMNMLNVNEDDENKPKGDIKAYLGSGFLLKIKEATIVNY